MNLTLHIVWKDFLCLRGRLACWVAVLVAKTLLGFAIITGDAPGYLAQHAMEASIVLVGLDIGLCFLLAVLLVQEDLLVGTRSFWLTRPVSGARLLGAKALGAALLFGALPVLIWLPWWLHCGYGVRELAWAVAETLYWQALVVVSAMLLAALTDSLGRVLLWSLVLLAGEPVGLALIAQWSSSAPSGVVAMRLVMLMVFLIVAALATVVRQYLSRQQWRSLAWFGGCCAAALVAAAFWPWNIFAGLDQPELREENAALAAGVTTEFESARAMGMLRKDVEEGRQDFQVHLRLRGVPAGLICAGGLTEQSWHWPDSPVFLAEGWSWSRTDPLPRVLGLAKREPDAETVRYFERKRAAIKLTTFRSRPDDGSDNILVHGRAPHSVVARLSREPASFLLRAQFQLLRPSVWFDETLKPSDWRTHSGIGGRICRVEPHESSVQLAAVQAQASFGNQSPLGLLAPRRGMQLAMAEVMQCVINRTKGDSVTFLWNADCAPMRVGTVIVRWISGEVKSPQVIRNGKWVPRDRDWLADARFAVISVSEIGRFVREVKVDKFTLNPAPEKK